MIDRLNRTWQSRLVARYPALFNQDINNHQTWYNAGLMAIGSVLGDAKLVDKVLHMRGGYYFQLEHSLGDEILRGDHLQRVLLALQLERQLFR